MPGSPTEPDRLEAMQALKPCPPADAIAGLLDALRPFTDLRHQRGAWGVITKALGGMVPLTVTVTKAQMQAALAAIARAEKHPAVDTAEKLARRMGGTFAAEDGPCTEAGCGWCGYECPVITKAGGR